MLFSIVAAPAYIPTNSVGGFSRKGHSRKREQRGKTRDKRKSDVLGDSGMSGRR